LRLLAQSARSIAHGQAAEKGRAEIRLSRRRA
jgi:hypothetical protein